MVKGIGIDVIEIERMKKMIDKWGEVFLKKIFTEHEILYAQSKIYSVQHYAVRFAAKEAFAKAIATGFSDIFRWKDIEIRNKETGEPMITLHGKLKSNFSKYKFLVSMSHIKSIAVAVVIVLDLGQVAFAE